MVLRAEDVVLRKTRPGLPREACAVDPRAAPYCGRDAAGGTGAATGSGGASDGGAVVVDDIDIDTGGAVDIDIDGVHGGRGELGGG